MSKFNDDARNYDRKNASGNSGTTGNSGTAGNSNCLKDWKSLIREVVSEEIQKALKKQSDETKAAIDKMSKDIKTVQDKPAAKVDLTKITDSLDGLKTGLDEVKDALGEPIQVETDELEGLFDRLDGFFDRFDELRAEFAAFSKKQQEEMDELRKVVSGQKSITREEMEALLTPLYMRRDNKEEFLKREEETIALQALQEMEITGARRLMPKR